MKPWENEPDAKEWESYGYHCVIRRGPLGAWCGYVGMPEDHPLYQEADPPTLYVHGGITFTGVGLKGMKDGLWYFGFDCAHMGDLAPHIVEIQEELGVPMPTFDIPMEYRTIEFAEAETERLAKQLWKIENLTKHDE